MSPADVVPAIEQTDGIGSWVTFLILAAMLALACAILLGLLRGHDTMPPAPPVTRPVHRCQAGRGPGRCPGQATRLVLVVGTETRTALLCDGDTAREVRLGRAVDLGPIGGVTR